MELRANIRRNRIFDIPKTRFPSESPVDSFLHPIEKLSPIRQEKPCCSDSWVIAPTQCLSDLYGLRDGTNPDLDHTFVISCYAPRNFSKYYTDWGCNGDSPYNAIYFLYVNGTIRNNCWESVLETKDGCGEPSDRNNPQTCSRVSIKCDEPEVYRIGESDLPGRNPDAFNVSPILGTDNKLTWPSQSPSGLPIARDTATNYLKHMVQRGPVITSFIVRESFLDTKGGDWDTNGIYTPRTGKIIGTHCAVIVGWGTTNGGTYWVLRNSWGTQWGPKYLDIPQGYWKHAAYSPETPIGSVDISIAGHHPELVAAGRRGGSGDPLGGAISIGISTLDTSPILDISKLKYAPYIRNSSDLYPQYVWIVLFILIVLITSKVFL